MSRPHGGTASMTRPGAHVGGVLVALVALMAALLVLAPRADAAEIEAPPVTLDSCTVTVPEADGVQYRQDRGNDNLMPAGTYEAHNFYPSVTFTAEATDGADTIAQGTETTEIDIPAICLVEIEAACETVTFSTTFDWGTLRVDYGPVGEAPEETGLTFDDSGTLTITPGYDSVAYTIEETELDRTSSGTVDLVCEAPIEEPAPEPVAEPAPEPEASPTPEPDVAPAEPVDPAPVPTVAPAAGW